MPEGIHGSTQTQSDIHVWKSVSVINSSFFLLVLIIHLNESIYHFHCMWTNSLKKQKWILIISFFVGEISKSKDLLVFETFNLIWETFRTNQECQKIFPARFPMSYEECHQKVFVYLFLLSLVKTIILLHFSWKVSVGVVWRVSMLTMRISVAPEFSILLLNRSVVSID